MSVEAGDLFGMVIRANYTSCRTIPVRNISFPFDLSKKALGKGNKNVKSILATCYFYGLIVEQNVLQAIKFWTECIENEDILVLQILRSATNIGLVIFGI